MKYKCELCDFETNNKHQIHHHHIVPVKYGGNNSKMNKIRVCPNCHNSIYIPYETDGIHSIRSENYIIIHNILQSTGGLLLEYSTKEKYNELLTLDAWRNTIYDGVF